MTHEKRTCGRGLLQHQVRPGWLDAVYAVAHDHGERAGVPASAVHELSGCDGIHSRAEANPVSLKRGGELVP
jgi:hypothetical protein